MLQKLNKKLSQNQKGFSLVELMVAVAILAIAVVGIFYAFTNAFHAMADSKYRTIATNLAQQKLEEVKNAVGIEFPFYEQEILNKDGMEFTINVVAIPPEDDEDSNYKEVTATISWINRNGVQKDVRLLTLVYDLETVINEYPEVGRIDLYADPDEMICCLDSEISTISAEVFDIDGERMVPSGTPINFSVSGGDITKEMSLTDSTGRATTELTIEDLGPATVIATSGLVDSDPLEVSCIPVANNITLEADPATIIPYDSSNPQAGGISTITAEIQDSCGETINSEIGEETITFTTDQGYFNGNPLTKTVDVDTLNGTATVELYMETPDTTATITGNFTNNLEISISDTTSVLCTDYSISVTADPETIFPSGGEPDFSTITATVTEAGGVAPSGDIKFNTDIGYFNGSPGNTEINVSMTSGTASVTLGGLEGGNMATVIATFYFSEGSVSDSVTIKCQQYLINIESTPNVITPDGESLITATLTDYLGNILGYRLIDFFTTKGVLSKTSSYTDGVTGEAITNLSGLASGENATVTASFGYASASTNVRCSKYTLELDAEPVSISPGENSQITATLEEYGEGSVNNATITFNTDQGQFENGLQSITAETNVDGQATVTLTMDSTGKATLTATYDIVEDTVEVNCFDTYITLNNPSNISNFAQNDRYLRFDLRLHGGPLTVDQVKVKWETYYSNRPTRYYYMWIGQPIYSNARLIYDNSHNSVANNDTEEDLNTYYAPYTIPEDSTFRIYIYFSDDIDHSRDIVFTFNPDDPGAENNYQVTFVTPW
jgi:prepilin-type N-terminal cleavage/methylation domain-containing protein